MSSELKLTNLKHPSSGSNNLVLASDGSATINQISSSSVFPAGHMVQSVFNPTISGASNTNHFTSSSLPFQLDNLNKYCYSVIDNNERESCLPYQERIC